MSHPHQERGDGDRIDGRGADLQAVESERPFTLGTVTPRCAGEDVPVLVGYSSQLAVLDRW
ncbi:hypothetical protein [Streptomyces canus]|uniref:hypothetical protein n=1 Tax=Streptomyces canus TaxID=58343 RepID=UPI0036EBA2DD